jgi:hypothetical protein
VQYKRKSKLAHCVREKYFVLNEVYGMGTNYFYPFNLALVFYIEGEA